MQYSDNWFYVAAVRLSGGGGQAVHVLESCRALARLRPTLLFAPAPPPQPIDGLMAQIVPLPERPPRELRFQMRLVRALGAAAQLASPRVVYVRAAAFNLGVMLSARRLGAAGILELNGLPALEYRLERGRSGRARGLAYALMARLDARLASGVVAVTPQLAAEARRWGARRVLVASNGVDPAAMRPLDIAAARVAHALPADAEIVGFAGNFAAWQGIETLIDAALLLAPRRPRLRLLLIGDGVERARLIARAAPLGDRVHFVGNIPHAGVAAALSACDLLAAPLALSERNRRTGVSPLKLFEYLALARPVIASALPGLEFIAADRLGATFAPGDATDLAAQLDALLALPAAERAAIGARARAAAEGRFSWQRITEGIVAFAENDSR
jgi:glycosyltransferase involved in cell wall biosynthesis